MPSLPEHAAVLVTGAASGIGRGFVAAMASRFRMCTFTLVDVNEQGCQETVRNHEYSPVYH